MPWRLVGTIAIADEWRILTTASYATTFMVSFNGNLSRIRSYAWFRQYFSNNVVSQAIRLYPKQESMVFELPIPQDMIDQGQLRRYLGAKRQLKYIRGIQLADPAWSITIRELI